MNFRGTEWREEQLRKRKIKYAIIDCLLLLVWMVGTVCFAAAVLTVCLTGNGELSLMLVGAALILWFIRSALDHGTFKF